MGVAYPGPVATFTDDAPDPNVGDYAATISWGDGHLLRGHHHFGQPVRSELHRHRCRRACLRQGDDGHGALCRHGQHLQGGHRHPGAHPCSNPPWPREPSRFPRSRMRNAKALDKKDGDFITAGQSFTDQMGEFQSDDPNATPADFGATIDWGDGGASART